MFVLTVSVQLVIQLDIITTYSVVSFNRTSYITVHIY